MLCDNLRNLRKAKGISQEEMAAELSVVRQTVSKWENGLSVPDAQMLIKIAQVLDTSVNVLLGEAAAENEDSEIKILAEKLEKLNEQIAKRNDRNRKIWRAVFIAVVIFAVISLGTDIAVLLNDKFPAGITSGSIGIIGGADGPTNIYVSDISFRFSSIILAVIAFAVSVAGLVKTRKK